jgi:hypothetical protein
LQVKAEITMILYKPQIKYLKSQAVWPVEFDGPSPPADGRRASNHAGMAAEEATLVLANMRLASSEEREEDADDEQDDNEDENDDSNSIGSEDSGGYEEIFKNTNRYKGFFLSI